MPDIDFTQIDDVQDFTPLPDGEYQCKLVEVEQTETLHGDEMWKLRFEVLDGEHAGRLIFDNLVFSATAQPRVKLICASLGLDVSGTLSLTTSMLKDRTCRVRVTTEDYVAADGSTKTCNNVPYAGYEPCTERSVGGEEASAPVSKEDIPF